ncbi:hypothetical protein Tsubulata_000884, partial [Turnera subulata]
MLHGNSCYSFPRLVSLIMPQIIPSLLLYCRPLMTMGNCSAFLANWIRTRASLSFVLPDFLWVRMDVNGKLGHDEWASPLARCTEYPPLQKSLGTFHARKS